MSIMITRKKLVTNRQGICCVRMQQKPKTHHAHHEAVKRLMCRKFASTLQCKLTGEPNQCPEVRNELIVHWQVTTLRPPKELVRLPNHHLPL